MGDKRQFLEQKAWEARILTIKAIAAYGTGHLGGSLSIAEVLTVLYFEVMNIDAAFPQWPGRDRFVLSKGHAAPGLYAVLTLKGILTEEQLFTLNQDGSKVPSHCDMRMVSAVDMTAGSLGQGISAAVGMAIAAKMDHTDIRVYAIVGDGECQEGEVWEAAMLAGHRKLDNLMVFLDNNKGQVDGFVEDVLSISPIDDKWRSFGWAVQTVDGHDVIAILGAVNRAKTTKGKPQMIVLNTIKAKGLAPLEGDPATHSMDISKEAAQFSINKLMKEGAAHA